MEITIRKIETTEELEQAWAIRHKVFVDEQKVDADLEYEYEEESVHFLALANGEPVGTARWRITEKGIKLERFAVLPTHRSQKIGQALLLALLRDLPQTSGKIYLHAQVKAEPFYARNGFVIKDDPFMEAGIWHYHMVLEM